MDSKAPPPQYAAGAPPAQYGAPPPQQVQPAYPQNGQPQPQYGPGFPQQPPPVVHNGGQPAPSGQYQAQAPMQVQKAAPNSSEWSHSLFDCSPCDTCCLATFLPCIVVGQTSDRLRDPTMATADTMNSDCLVFTAIQCFTGCGWIYIMMKRTEIRERFGIQGDGTADCCSTYWCPCCALIQQDNEVKSRTQGAVPINQGYQAQPGMQMQQA